MSLIRYVHILNFVMLNSLDKSISIELSPNDCHRFSSKIQHKSSKVCNTPILSRYVLRVIPQNSIAHPYCVRFSRHQCARSGWLFPNGLPAKDKSPFFLGNEYQDLTIFLFTLNAEITFFLYSGYGPISIAEKK